MANRKISMPFGLTGALAGEGGWNGFVGVGTLLYAISLLLRVICQGEVCDDENEEL